MTRFLISDENPAGSRLEDILSEIRRDVIVRCGKIVDDKQPEARRVLDNNMRVLGLLSEAIAIAEDSTQVLDTAFGRSRSDDGGPPRIGVA